MTYEETIEWIFLSTLSLRRATGDAFYLDLVSGISIHALLAESDNHATLDAGGNDLFLSTLSLRRATVGDTPPCCGCMISIHALLAESDLTFTFTLILLSVISIHALLAESDFKANVHRAKSRLFLSTLSLRRATILCVLPVVQHTDFYPRSPCGERRVSTRIDTGNNIDFYPRSPCGERQWHLTKHPQHKLNFYPRSPCGERPNPKMKLSLTIMISIHALLAESDLPTSILHQS